MERFVWAKGLFAMMNAPVCSVASGRHLAGVPELALLLCGVHQKATIAILDTSARWNSHVPWVLFSEQLYEAVWVWLAFLLDWGSLPGIGHAIVYHQIHKKK